jgi:hypothetical protein
MVLLSCSAMQLLAALEPVKPLVTWLSWTPVIKSVIKHDALAVLALQCSCWQRWSL